MPHSRVIRLERHEHVGRLLQQDAGVILERWARRAAEEQPDAARVHHHVLLDHLAVLLDALGVSLSESDEEAATAHRVPAIQHGEQRWESGWSLPELSRDYQLLRTVLFEHLGEVLSRPLHTREILAINLALDEAVAASVGMYVASREQAVRQAERQRVESERRAEEERLRREAESLKEMDRRKDEFLAILGHELRGPLAPIRNVVQVFQLGPPTADTVRWATGIVERQVRHMARLVDDLLDVTRINRGKVQLQPERLDLARLVRDTAEDRRGALEAAGVTLELQAEGGAVWVRGDPVRLAQVVGNLLHNAGKFSNAGGQVTVRVRGENGRAAVAVRDTGVGIDPDELPHLFETFRQADRNIHRSDGGLGLGLALVRGLVELHGGKVWAASDGVGRGAEFTFWVPLDESANNEPVSGGA
jgi:signal transduction histidine kinase